MPQQRRRPAGPARGRGRPPRAAGQTSPERRNGAFVATSWWCGECEARRLRHPRPLFFLQVLIPGDFKSNDFACVHCKGLAEAFFGSAHPKGLVAFRLNQPAWRCEEMHGTRGKVSHEADGAWPPMAGTAFAGLSEQQGIALSRKGTTAFSNRGKRHWWHGLEACATPGNTRPSAVLCLVSSCWDARSAYFFWRRKGDLNWAATGSRTTRTPGSGLVSG